MKNSKKGWVIIPDRKRIEKLVQEEFDNGKLTGFSEISQRIVENSLKSEKTIYDGYDEIIYMPSAHKLVASFGREKTVKEQCIDMFIAHKDIVLKASTLYGSLMISPQQLRRIIASLRFEGRPIVSKGNGYKGATDYCELQAYYENRMSNIRKEQLILSNMIKERNI